MKHFCLIAALVFSVVVVHGQTTRKDDCFPSGYSLQSASIINNGNNILVYNMLYFYKLFDKTGKLIGVRNYNDRPFEQEKTGSRKPLYDIKRYLGDSKNSAFHYTITDLTGKEVAVYKPKEWTVDCFNRYTGTLILTPSSPKDKLTIIKLNAKPYKADPIRYADEPTKRWDDVSDNEFFTGDDKYLVTDNGDVLDIDAGKFHDNVFQVDRTNGFRKHFRNLYFNKDETVATLVHNQLFEAIVVDMKTWQVKYKYAPAADLPRIQGFRILPGDKEGEYLYWMDFYTKAPVAGLAYWVENNKIVPLCDPNWKNENADNLLSAVKTYKTRDSLEQIANRKREEEELERNHAIEKSNEKTSDPEMNKIIATAIKEANANKKSLETEYYFYKVINPAFGFRDKAFVFEASPDADYLIQVITKDVEAVNITGRADDGLKGGEGQKASNTYIKGYTIHSYVWSQKDETGQVFVTPYKSSTKGLGVGDDVKAYILVFRFLD